MDLPVTAATAVILGAWLVILSWRVIRGRQGRISEEMLNRRIRGQANFGEYAPFAMMLIFVAEMQNANFLALSAIAAIFVVGRLLHGIAFSYTAKWVLGRVGGTILTLAGLSLLVILNLWQLLVGV